MKIPPSPPLQRGEQKLSLNDLEPQQRRELP